MKRFAGILFILCMAHAEDLPGTQSAASIVAPHINMITPATQSYDSHPVYNNGHQEHFYENYYGIYPYYSQPYYDRSNEDVFGFKKNDDTNIPTTDEKTPNISKQDDNVISSNVKCMIYVAGTKQTEQLSTNSIRNCIESGIGEGNGISGITNITISHDGRIDVVSCNRKTELSSPICTDETR